MATPQADEQESTGAAGASVLARHPSAIALGGGVAAAFGSSFIPMNAIEGFVTAYGIAELLPAAAPPLGDTARLALSAGIGTLTAGALLALLPRAESDEMGFETSIRKADNTGNDASQPGAPVAKSGKLASWLRTLRFGKSEPAPGTITDFSDLAAPRIRNGDQHPDAPVRAPIRASEDLGAPLTESEPVAAAPLELGESMAVIAPVNAPAPNAPAPAPSLRFAPPPFAAPFIEPDIEEEAETRFAAPDAPEPEPTVELAQASEEPAADARFEHVAEPEQAEAAWSVAAAAHPVLDAMPVDALPETGLADELDHLSVAELLARLEAGLARRRHQAQTDRTGMAADGTGAQIFALGKPSVDETGEGEAVRPFRLRLGDVPRFEEQAVAADEPTEVPAVEDSAEAETASFRAQPLWDEDVEYLPPSVSTSAAEPMVDEAATDAPGSVEAAPAAPAATEDDMDAALRDALATLRQLSDRQRGS